jgi:hypothetical protein
MLPLGAAELVYSETTAEFELSNCKITLLAVAKRVPVMDKDNVFPLND